jgi:glycerate 2-kinase
MIVGATLRPKAAFLLDALRFDSHLRAAHLVICGEGRLDMQTAQGKVVAIVADRARGADVPC